MQNAAAGVEKINVVVFSLDYDNSAGTLLSDKNDDSLRRLYLWLINSIRDHQNTSMTLKELIEAHLDDSRSEQQMQWMTQFIQEIKDEFFQFLEEKTAGKEHVLMVGSNRQDFVNDFFNSFCNKNFLCFEAYREFAEKRGIEFSEFLLGDVFDAQGQRHAEEKPAGTTMRAPKPECMIKKNETTQVLAARLKLYALSPGFPDHKKTLLQTQLQHIEKRYPKDLYNVHYIFMDDLNDVIQHNQDALKNGTLVHESHINCEIIPYDLTKKLAHKFLTALSIAPKENRKRKIEDTPSEISVFKTSKVEQEPVEAEQKSCTTPSL